MHFAERAWALIVLASILAIAAIWSDDPALDALWALPVALLLLGLALEAWATPRTPLQVDVEGANRLLLGVERTGAFVFRTSASRDLRVEYAPVMPEALEPFAATRVVDVPASGEARDALTLSPVRLGRQRWPDLPARLLGRLGLAWWSRELALGREFFVAPDAVRGGQLRPRGFVSGQRARRTVGAGSELHQLRPYVPGDVPGRIDWKATARSGVLTTREYSEDQHLDIVVMIDAGRRSRARAGRLDRLGLYANVAARFAQYAVTQDDRVGLCVFSDRVHALLAPARGAPAVAALRGALERLERSTNDSDPRFAAARVRRLLHHRSLVLLFTDLEDPLLADGIARAVRALSPPHLALVASVMSPEIEALARARARTWRDPWIAIAAREQFDRTQERIELLRRTGVPVVATREERLESSVFAQYETLRRRRRI